MNTENANVLAQDDVPQSPERVPSLSEFLQQGPYVGYCYSYPHKTAYREFATALDLQDIWRSEKRDSLFLYIHIPFCEMRCGFCNLFTFSQPNSKVPSAYLEKLKEQAAVTMSSLAHPRFAQVAIGGGTPTFLTPQEIETLFSIVSKTLSVDAFSVPISMEASPATINPDKLTQLKELGVTRLSMGVQSLNAKDAGTIGRPQKNTDVIRAIEMARQTGFESLNLDLIYGGSGQTMKTWLESVRQCAEYRPEEIFLYPLYVRPLTGIFGRSHCVDDDRLSFYREARQYLLDDGYEQTSMRMFRLKKTVRIDTRYRCQEDGMVGLGVGARSYTREFHYGSQYAVKQKSVGEIIDRYLQRPVSEFSSIEFGFQLSEEERRTRYLIISLLQASGLERSQYRAVHGIDVLADPRVHELWSNELITVDSEFLRLTNRGLEMSDAIGPWLYTRDVRTRMESYSWTGN